MSLSKKILFAFIFFYIITCVYLLLFFTIPEVQNFIISIRSGFVGLTEGTNYYWALLIAFLACLIGSASIGFPIPFPFILFTLSNSLLMKYGKQGLYLEEILSNGAFWLEISGLIFIGGLGCVIGELAGYFVGYGSRKLFEKSESEILKNLNGFGKLLIKNKKRTPLYIFLFSLTPLPDDALFIPLGLLRYNLIKAISFGWLGKNITTLFYCLWPILIQIGLLNTGIELDAVSDVVIEAIMVLITITIMIFLFGFDWSRYIEDKHIQKDKQLTK